MVVSWTLQWFNITYATTFCAIPFLGFLPIHTTDVVYLMPQHCCYLLHTHKDYFRLINWLSSRFFGMVFMTVSISQGTKFSQKHSHCTTHH